MNTAQFLKYINKPQLLNRDSLEEIQKLAELLPYSQNIQFLYLFNLSNTQDIRFGDQLQKTATYAADRRLLKKQIEELKKSIVSVSEEANLQAEPIVPNVDQASNTENEIEERVFEREEAEEPIVPSSSISEKLIYDKNPEAQPEEDLIGERNRIRSKAELLQLVKERLSEIETKKANKPVENIPKETLPEEKKEESLKNKLDLIDKFIQVEPSISRPEKTAFFNPDVAAQESLFDDGAYVTETLAKIYYDQGNYRKAIEIYRVLSLNNPKKSSYFAALIQELENKIN